MGGKVTDNVGDVNPPEGANSLIRGNTAEAIHNTNVSCDLYRDDLWVGILGLDQELHRLNGSCALFGEGSGDTSGKNIYNEIS